MTSGSEWKFKWKESVWLTCLTAHHGTTSLQIFILHAAGNLVAIILVQQLLGAACGDDGPSRLSK
jgi:hypothetical protein